MSDDEADPVRTPPPPPPDWHGYIRFAPKDGDDPAIDRAMRRTEGALSAIVGGLSALLAIVLLTIGLADGAAAMTAIALFFVFFSVKLFKAGKEDGA